MDWNLFLTKRQRIAERFLDLLQHELDGHPVSKTLNMSRTIDLDERLNSAKSTLLRHGNRQAYARPENRARDKWFDAK
jgi:hypothetical protein